MKILNSFHRWTPKLVVLGLWLCAAQTRGEGVFADFTTSMGNFSCELDYSNAPMTVANFVGLAEGSRPWLDLATGLTRTNAPFYNGLTFHRIYPTDPGPAPMIQGGSPNGLGTDSPGYKFRDEFSTNLTFNAAGVIAMANSGANTAGSQFFVTVEAVPTWNNSYTVFGHVSAGMDIVSNISSVARNASTGVPDVPVVISNVVIRREGAAAQAFDVNAHGLPVVTNLAAGLYLNTNGLPTVDLFLEQYYGYWIFLSADMNTWVSQDLGTQLIPPVTNHIPINVDTSPTVQFFNLGWVAYPRFVPTAWTNQTIRFNWAHTDTFPHDGVAVDMTFAGSGGGSYIWSQFGTTIGSGSVVSNVWQVHDAYRALLNPATMTGSFIQLIATMNFVTATNGTFIGDWYTTPTSGFGSITGDFTVTTP